MAISDYSQQAASVVLTLTTEVVVNTNVVDSGAGGQFPQGRVIRGYVNVTPGGTAGTLTLRVRQNTLTGAVVGIPDVVNLAIATAVSVPFSKQDNSVQGASAYVLTATVTGAAGAANDSALEIEMPTPYGSEV
jgi:hypothetical protein